MIELTQEQKDSYLKDKKDRFIKGMKKVEEETGMTLVPSLRITEYGIVPVVSILPVNKEKDGNINTKAA